MAEPWLTEEVLNDALCNALAAIHEWDGGNPLDKMAALGVDGQGLVSVCAARWRIYAVDHGHDDNSKVLFIRAFAEGLIAGLVAQRNRTPTTA